MIAATLALAALVAQSGENTWGDLGTLTASGVQSLGAGSALIAVDDHTLVLAPASRYFLVRYNVPQNQWVRETTTLLAPIDYSGAIALKPGTSTLVLMQYFGVNGYKLTEYDASAPNPALGAQADLPTGTTLPMLAITPTATYVVISDSGGAYLYEGVNGLWTKKKAFPLGYASPSTPGMTLTWPGSGNFLYATMPNVTNTFYRYAITAGGGQAADTWTAMPEPPTPPASSFGADGDGATMAAGPGGMLYYFAGARADGAPMDQFYRFDIAGNAWSTLASTLWATGAGAALAPLPGSPYIYALRGAYTRNWGRYERPLSAPDAPGSLGQFEAIAGTPNLPLENGIAYTSGTSIVVKATVSHRESEAVALEVEAKPVGVDFNESGIVQGATAPSGGTASVTLGGLTFGGWHWRVRGVTPSNKRSGWVNFGTNGDPNGVDVDVRVNVAPNAVPIEHVRVSTGTAVASGATLMSSEEVAFRARIVDLNGDSGNLEIEIRPQAAAFSGEATSQGPTVASGQVSGVTPVLAPGSYHWQGRMVDQRGLASAWTASADFTILPSGSTNGPSCFSSTTGSSGLPLLTLAVALLALRRMGR